MFDHFQEDIKAAQGRHCSNLLQLVFLVGQDHSSPCFPGAVNEHLYKTILQPPEAKYLCPFQSMLELTPQLMAPVLPLIQTIIYLPQGKLNIPVNTKGTESD